MDSLEHSMNIALYNVAIGSIDTVQRQGLIQKSFEGVATTLYYNGLNGGDWLFPIVYNYVEMDK